MVQLHSRKAIFDYILIMIGSSLLALGINVFYDDLGLVVGGVTGIGIIIKKMTATLFEGGIPIYITDLAINIPLFIVGIVIKGKSFGGRSLFASLWLSFSLFLTQGIPSITQDMLLGCVFGSVLSGVGLGLVFYALATTGGTDLAASIIQHFIKYISIAKIMLVLDGVIILWGLFTFGAERTMYAMIAVFLSAKVIDAILEGLKFAKAAFIITEEEDAVAKRLLVELERGVTGLHGEGMYTGLSKNVLLCVVSKRQIVELKEIVKEIDPKAFVIVADVREVLGEGFTH